MNEFIYIQKMK